MNDRSRNTSRHAGLPHAAIPVAVAAISLIFIAPFTYLVVRTTGDAGRAWNIAASRTALAPLWRTVQLAAIVTVGSVIIGTGAAWLVERTDLPGRRVVRLLLALPLGLPSFVGAATLLNTFNRGGVLDEVLGIGGAVDLRGLGGAAVVLCALSYPYVFLPVAARVRSLNPNVEESARLLGHGPFEVFRLVVLPQLTMPVAAGALLVFLYALSDFGAVQLVRYDTLTRSIYEARLLDPTTSAVLGLMLGGMALVLTAAERRVGRRIRAVAPSQSPRLMTQPLGRWRWPAAAAVISVVAVALLAPIAVLSWWVWRGMRNGQSLTGAESLLPAAAGTVASAVSAAALCLVITFPLAWLSVRRAGPVASVASVVVTAGFALPGLVLALALVQWFIGTPLYQTFLLLILAHAIHFGAQALRATQVAVTALPRRLDEAAVLLGAGLWRRATRVALPVMAPGLAASAGLVMLSVVKELPVTLLLRPTAFDTLSVRIWSAAEDAFLARLGFASLVLLAASGTLTGLVVARPLGRR